jgi:phosphate acetyltransferase
MERIVGNCRASQGDADVMVIEGLVPTATGSFASQLNPAMVKALSAQVILVSSLASGDLTEFQNQIEFAASQFGGVNSREVIGCVANKVHVNPRGDFEPIPASIVAENEGSSESLLHSKDDTAVHLRRTLSNSCPFLKTPNFDLIGAVPWNAALPARRLSDIASALNASIIHKGDMDQRRVRSIALCARTIPYMLHVIKPGTLLVTPPDRQDVILAAAMAALSRIPIAGLLLVGEYKPDPQIFDFIRAALETGLPILYVNSQSYHTATALFQMSDEVPLDDVERIERVMEFTASQIDADWLEAYCKTNFEQRMSPAAFRYQLVEKARQERRRIVLPEGEEPRTLEAAVQCQNRGIADCILMGDPESIRRNAQAGGLELPGD